MRPLLRLRIVGPLVAALLVTGACTSPTAPTSRASADPKVLPLSAITREVRAEKFNRDTEPTILGFTGDQMVTVRYGTRSTIEVRDVEGGAAPTLTRMIRLGPAPAVVNGRWLAWVEMRVHGMATPRRARIGLLDLESNELSYVDDTGRLQGPTARTLGWTNVAVSSNQLLWALPEKRHGRWQPQLKGCNPSHCRPRVIAHNAGLPTATGGSACYATNPMGGFSTFVCAGATSFTIDNGLEPPEFLAVTEPGGLIGLGGWNDDEAAYQIGPTGARRLLAKAPAGRPFTYLRSAGPRAAWIDDKDAQPGYLVQPGIDDKIYRWGTSREIPYFVLGEKYFVWFSTKGDTVTRHIDEFTD